MATTAQSSRKRSKKRSKKRSSPAALITMIGVAVVALLVALVIVSGGGQTFPEAQSTGEALPPFSDAGQDPAVGSAAPALSGETLDGEQMTFQPGEDGPRAVLFVAHWCGFCQEEVPVIQDLIDSGDLAASDVLAVTTAIDRNRGNFPPDEWLEGEGWTPTTLVDSGSAAAEAYGQTAFPFWVLVDESGQVTERRAGALGEQGLRELLASYMS